MPAVIERHLKVKPDVQERLAASKAGAEAKALRTIRCPNCGFYLLNVYGQKCKFSETIDTALFRTMGRKQQKRLQAYCEEIGKKLQR